ncbi:MAG: hypothetical protein ABGY24_16430, partial [bacterium]
SLCVLSTLLVACGEEEQPASESIASVTLLRDLAADDPSSPPTVAAPDLIVLAHACLTTLSNTRILPLTLPPIPASLCAC